MRATVDPVDDAAVRRTLDALGKRRKKLRKMQDELAEDIREAMPDVRLCKSIPIEEAAQRLGLNRTTIYQVYLADGDEQPTARAA